MQTLSNKANLREQLRDNIRYLGRILGETILEKDGPQDRKSTRLNSSHT